jgi:hypothetical protein
MIEEPAARAAGSLPDGRSHGITWRRPAVLLDPTDQGTTPLRGPDHLVHKVAFTRTQFDDAGALTLAIFTLWRAGSVDVAD